VEADGGSISAESEVGKGTKGKNKEGRLTGSPLEGEKPLFSGCEGSFLQNDEERFWAESREQREESRKIRFRADFGQF
jgi:hypothetical protein